MTTFRSLSMFLIDNILVFRNRENSSTSILLQKKLGYLKWLDMHLKTTIGLKLSIARLLTSMIIISKIKLLLSYPRSYFLIYLFFLKSFTGFPFGCVRPFGVCIHSFVQKRGQSDWDKPCASCFCIYKLSDVIFCSLGEAIDLKGTVALNEKRFVHF